MFHTLNFRSLHQSNDSENSVSRRLAHQFELNSIATVLKRTKVLRVVRAYPHFGKGLTASKFPHPFSKARLSSQFRTQFYEAQLRVRAEGC